MDAVMTKALGTTLLERDRQHAACCGSTEPVRASRRGSQILGKAEWANPGGSVKDRAASNDRARMRSSEGLLQFGRRERRAGVRTLLDATSGNTGIAYAMLGAAQGFPVTLCMPSNVIAWSASCILAGVWRAGGVDGSGGWLRRGDSHGAEADCGESAGASTSMPTSMATTTTGLRTITGTANEIWEQTDGRCDALCQRRWGPAGTFMGTTRRLRELNPRDSSAFRCSRTRRSMGSRG